MIYITGGQFTGKLGTIIGETNTSLGKRLQVQIRRKGLGLIISVKPSQIIPIPSFKVN